MNNSKKIQQIFQTNHPGRWHRFKWSLRMILFLLGLMLTVMVIAYKTLYLPPVTLESRAIKKVLINGAPGFRESKLGKQYRGFRRYIMQRWATGRGCGQKKKGRNISALPILGDDMGIRAAFYVTWDNQSFFSLRRNISKINVILPEWFFIDPKTDTLFSDIDEPAYDLIKASGIKVLPMISNNFNGAFNGTSLQRIVNDETKKKRLISSIINMLDKYHFNGVNLDFEEIMPGNNKKLIAFERDLYKELHKRNYLVTQNLAAFNDDFNKQSLDEYNDYVFLMAYDQHYEGSAPGPICEQEWVENAVNHLAKEISPSKIVLNLAAYGYDWAGNKPGNVINYQQALSTARDSQGQIYFDNGTYNLNYDYYDDQDVLHHVFFTDAATNFNTMRFATEYGLAGAALWRLGSEDSRIWTFYNLPMTKTALKSFNFNQMEDVQGNTDIDLIGEGEILDLVATPTAGHITPDLDSENVLINNETYNKLPSTYVVRKLGVPKSKKVLLTYDDGPDANYTPQILDTLAYYHVPAAFFLVGVQAEDNIPLVKREFDAGYEIGNHTFLHPNMAIVSLKRANFEMDATRLLIECITGHSTIMFRAPYNADSDPESQDEMIPMARARNRNYITVGYSLDPNDWMKAYEPTMNADTVYNRVVRQHEAYIKDGDTTKNIILLHDGGGDRSATVKATGMIIRYFLSKGYEFTTVEELLGKSRDDLMPPVPKNSGYYLLQFNFITASTYYVFTHVLTALFILFMALGALRVIILCIMAFIQKKREKRLLAYANKDTSREKPFVSIIVPAYNEDVNAVSSLQNLLRCDYENFDIIFVDDGSSDNTFKKVNEAFSGHEKIKLFTKENGGKASALNFGISHSLADFVVCIDADTQLQPDAIRMMMLHFTNPQVGAVAGVVKVGNEVNILTKWQSIEYISAQNFDRKGFSLVNAIMVIPGAIGTFRKEALIQSGGFTSDTLAEDCDLTVRILKNGYIVDNEPKAIAYTEVPESTRQLMKQRTRWTFGILQTFWKHRDLLFNTKYGTLGWIILPDLLLFRYIIPLFTPLADLFMILGFFSDNPGKIGGYYVIFLLADALIAGIAFAFESEKKPWKLIWLIPQRLIYRWILLIVLFRSFKKAIKGELQNWGVLRRTGNVKETT